MAEFFDYTDDFADNSVTSIGMTFISAAIVASKRGKCMYVNRGIMWDINIKIFPARI